MYCRRALQKSLLRAAFDYSSVLNSKFEKSRGGAVTGAEVNAVGSLL
jgi:hypothetical protein